MLSISNMASAHVINFYQIDVFPLTKKNDFYRFFIATFDFQLPPSRLAKCGTHRFPWHRLTGTPYAFFLGEK